MIELARPEMIKSKWTHMQIENLMHRIENILSTNLVRK